MSIWVRGARALGRFFRLFGVAERYLLEPDSVLPERAVDVQVPVYGREGTEPRVPADRPLGSTPLGELG